MKSSNHSNPGQSAAALPRRPVLAALAALAGLGLWRATPSMAAERAVVIPPPKDDQAATGGSTSETAVLAGGCFWGVQGVFQHVKGVSSAVSGYAGGDAASANYDAVGLGTTGHAESVRITYDPRQVSYGRLLQIFFSVAHNPTELNRQGPDTGTQYRSAIFPANAEQTRIARNYIAQLDKTKVFGKPIATTIEPLKAFYPAEGYHQDFMTRNPDHPYIAFNDLPKVDNLKRVFPEIYRAKPVLVGSGA
ncbi:peptide-methionine (S)-S-oxide reductase MsrA [Variovorax sp. J22R24]|uniref:peptide-methionine (S)-S-oxide reductase MsrA n=1 Tax=Variovorax gracilis TaxID=3053502 RepID=UPI002577D193|nr:peptide-methionine (S)-S-oxide reductase MsrA [Variovorax sp. J22R24]MDM0105515.1 peptide-methionine (S)-S-oxide reductase MsrA [Variovorax sp. J22R24]